MVRTGPAFHTLTQLHSLTLKLQATPQAQLFWLQMRSALHHQPLGYFVTKS
jgi:hypothetical protein